MKKISLILLTLFIATLSKAQDDGDVRTTPPEPGPAPEINIGSYELFELKNDLKVILVENHKIPKVSFSLIVDIDPIFEGDKAGYISMAGDLLDEGTKNRSKEELNEEIDFIGATLSSHSKGLYASSLTKHSGKLMELMTDVLFNPSFPEEELEKLIKQRKSSLAAEASDPNSMASRVSKIIRYGKDHPYGELVTEESLSNIEVSDCRKYYDTYFKPNVSYLVIVGDMTKREAKKLTKKYFKSWKEGEVPSHEYKQPEPPQETSVAFVEKDGAVQSVINISYPIELQPGSENSIPANVMNNILGGQAFSSRLMQNLREDKAYTYGASSSLSPDEYIGNFRAGASVRNEVTDSATEEILNEMEKMKTQEVSEDDLSLILNRMTGNFARSLERPQTVAGFALNIERYDLPEDYYQDYLKNLNDVSVEDVINAAREYLLPERSNILIVGNPDEVKQKMERFGEITTYDVNGNEVTIDPAANLDVTSEEVIKNYIKAIGGRKTIESLDDINIEYEGSFQGATIKQEIYWEPEKFMMAIYQNGMMASKTILNKDQGRMISPQGPQRIPDDKVDEVKRGSRLFPELFYIEENFNLKLKGVKSVKGEEAYEMVITNEKGKSHTNYYSKETGLLLQKTETQQSQMGAQTINYFYDDYREVEGVKLPHKVIQGFGQVEINLEATKVEVNEGIDKDVFDVD